MAAEKEQLIKELTNLLQEIEPEGLTFLKEQAAILIYNQDVNRRNQSPAGKREKSIMSPGINNDAKPAPPAKVYIEQLKNGKYFNLCIRNSKLFMDTGEIKALFQIARSAGSPEDGASHLYKWFKKERSDVLLDGSIRDKNSPVLKLIYQELLNSFMIS